jgi:hypothetical protein
MGLFWDLIQHSQISNQRESHESLEERVRYLETLETHFGRDIDGDGRVIK